MGALVLRPHTHILKPSALKQAGFTLVELLTILLIIGLMSSAVIMNLPRAAPQAKALSAQLIKQLNNTAQQSLISGSPTGFGLSKQGYGFYNYDGENWVLRSSENWPDDITPDVTVDSESLKLSAELLPLVIFEPTGGSSVFTLSLKTFNAEYNFSSIGDGRVVLESKS